jgi:hypothetical protein
MTTQELNRDIKRLVASIKKKQGTPEYYDYTANEAKAEFMRLFRADQEFRYMNKHSIRMMLRLNVLYRYVPFHHFGIMINL